MTADLTAEEYYEIYLRSKDAKQEKEKKPSTQLARGGSFKVVSQTCQKAQKVRHWQSNPQACRELSESFFL
jgi:hypothetical protein